MRVVAALFCSLVVALSGCGSGGKSAAPRGTEAAKLVPPEALAFFSTEDETTGVWRKLSGGLAIAPGESYAVLDLGADRPAVVGFVKADDDRVSEFPTFFREHKRRYTVETIRGWRVAADSSEAFEAVRAAASGRSLAEVDGFRRAMQSVEGDAIVRAYADGARLKTIPGELGALFRVTGARGWVGARAYEQADAARLSVHFDANEPVYRPRLLREVPSGALLAVSFKDAGELIERVAVEPSLREYRRLFTDLAFALRDEGVFYVTQGVLLPTIVLEIESPDSAAAARSLRRVAAQLSAETKEVLTPHVLVRGHRVVLTTATAAPASGGRLVDDQPFKDALAAADVPDDVTWLAYADLHRLVPIVQSLSQLLGAGPPSPQQTRTLDRLGTLVAFGARAASASRVELRLTSR